MSSDSDFSFKNNLVAASASLPTVIALQARIAELVDQLGRQGPELTATQQELERLRTVEANLSQSAEQLRGEITALKASHRTELEAVVSAGDALRAERDAAVTAKCVLQAERDDVVAKLEAMTLRHNNDLTKARRSSRASLRGMREMDALLIGELSCSP